MTDVPDREWASNLPGGRAVVFADAVRESESRDENREGIPVFLALEDVGARPAGDSQATERAGDRLAQLAREYLLEQLAGREQATLDDVAVVLRVLGAHHFDEQV